MKSHRLARVSEVVREVAAEAILFEIRDPRVKGVTVTRAEVSADLQHAKVHVSIMGTEKEQKLCLHGLEAAAGFVQSKLAKRLTTRYIPHVTFVLDQGVKKSIEIARVIAEELARSAPVDNAAVPDTDNGDEEDETDDAPDGPADATADPDRPRP
jgi:ribosome-binding factor A